MKKNLLFVVFGATILLTMNACKSELDLDKELKFSKLTVEQQKSELEKSGLDFITSMEGMQDTKAMTTIMNMLEMRGSNEFSAPMQRLSSDISNANKMAFTNFDQQMRVSYVESEIWGEWVYNFETEEIEKIKDLNNQLIVRFPATATAKTNTGEITVNYSESTVVIPDADEKYPSEITFKMLVDAKEAMAAKFTGTYHADGMPKKVTQTLTIDDYKWEAKIENDKKTADESYEFKKGKTVLVKTLAEVKGTLTYDELMDALELGKPEKAVKKFAAFFQVMDVAVKGGTEDLPKFKTEMGDVDYRNKSSVQKYVDAINNNFVFTAYFVDAKRKFADVEYYVSEYSFQEYDYTSYPYQLKTITEYWISPRFVLSDGSKVDVDEYFSKGFDKIIERIQNMEIDF